jgi:hypothetical protein
MSSQLNEVLEDKKLFLKNNRRTKFANKVRNNYFNSLTIVSTLQTFELEFPPFIQKLSHMLGEAIIQWIKSILRFKLIFKEIMDLHKGFEEWPIRYMDETERFSIMWTNTRVKARLLSILPSNCQKRFIIILNIIENIVRNCTRN